MEKQLPPPLIIWRCAKCGRRIADVRLAAGSAVTIKCAACNTMNTKAA